MKEGSMKKTIAITVCVLIAVGAIAAGLILFLPRCEKIHIEHSFVKTHIADAEIQEDMPEGTKLDTVIDITVTENNAGMCNANGTVKLGEQTIEVNSVTVSSDGYTLSRKENGSSVADLFWHRADKNNTSLVVYSGKYYGNWWYSDN